MTCRPSGCQGNNSAAHGVGGQLSTFAAAVVGEEDEADVAHAPQQNGPGRRAPVGRGGGDDHGVGLVDGGPAPGRVPGVELRNRVGVDVALGQPDATVLLPELGQVHRIRPWRQTIMARMARPMMNRPPKPYSR